MKILRLLPIITLFLIGFSHSTQAQFTDIQKDSLDYLYKHHYIDGYPDGSFGPKKQINRAEFVTLILRAQNVPLIPNLDCFADIKSELWYHDYVCTAKELGYVKGYDGNLFKPEQSITKVEALKIMSEVQHWAPFNGPDIKVGFKDIKKGEWYYDYVKVAEYNHYIDTVSYFKPAEFITREDVSEILFRTIVDEKMYFELNEHDLGLIVRDFFKMEVLAAGKTYNDFLAYQEKYPDEAPVFLKSPDGYTYAIMHLYSADGFESDDYFHSNPIVLAKFDASNQKVTFDWDNNHALPASGPWSQLTLEEASQNKMVVSVVDVYRGDPNTDNTFKQPDEEYILKELRN